MNFLYDFHIHSALSPCADNDMSPANIVATASAVGLEIIAISDHNAIKNVDNAMKYGELLGVTVVPAIEVQTNEDIHVLCLFRTLTDLENFYKEIDFSDIPNRPDIFGEQLIFDEEDEVIGYEPTMLINSANISETDLYDIANKHNGIAIPAHIDRDSYGMLAVLGGIPDEYKVVEISSDGAVQDFINHTKGKRVITDSDAHTLEDIGKKRSLIDLPECTANALIDFLQGKI